MTIIRFDIIDRHTGNVVGTAKSRASARASVDRRDNEYGAYRYSAKPIYGEPTHAEAIQLGLVAA